MTLDSLMNIGVQGMSHSQGQITRAATEIAQASPSGAADSGATNSGTQSLVEPALTIQAEQHVFNASAKVVSVADEALGKLIDTSA